MRHNKKKHLTGTSHDKGKNAMRNMVTSFFLHEKITLTKSDAKTLVSKVDKLISYAKKHNTMNAIRHLNSELFDETASRKIIDTLLEKYQDVSSGFTRKTFAGFRKGDNAAQYTITLR